METQTASTLKQVYCRIRSLSTVLTTCLEHLSIKWKKTVSSRKYPAKTITDADYADDIALLANAPAQAETLLHSMELAAAGICLQVNAHKTECMCFNQRGEISTLNNSSLKLVDRFTYLGNSVSSTDKDIDTRLAKHRLLSIEYLSDGSQTWPIKWNAASS